MEDDKVKCFLKEAMEEAARAAAPNENKMMRMAEAKVSLEKMFGGGIEVGRNEFFPDSGYITLKLINVLINHEVMSDWLRVIALADAMEVVPTIDGTIQMIFTFNQLLTDGGGANER